MELINYNPLDSSPMPAVYSYYAGVVADKAKKSASDIKRLELLMDEKLEKDPNANINKEKKNLNSMVNRARQLNEQYRAMGALITTGHSELSKMSYESHEQSIGLAERTIEEGEKKLSQRAEKPSTEKQKLDKKDAKLESKSQETPHLKAA